MRRGAADERAFGREFAFLAPYRGFVEGRGTEVPLDRAGSQDAYGFETASALDVGGHWKKRIVSDGSRPVNRLPGRPGV